MLNKRSSNAAFNDADISQDEIENGGCHKRALSETMATTLGKLKISHPEDFSQNSKSNFSSSRLAATIHVPITVSVPILHRRRRAECDFSLSPVGELSLCSALNKRY